MKLTVKKRSGASKSELTKMRDAGNIPAILYHSGQKGEIIEINGNEYASIMRQVKKGHLPTTVFELEGDFSKVRAIVKEVQYHPTTYQILHIDLMLLADDRAIEVNIPVDYSGVADCAGIKLGGFLREVSRQIKVRCLPKDMPKQFELNVAKLGVKQSLRVKDVDFPKGVTTLKAQNEVIVTIAKR